MFMQKSTWIIILILLLVAVGGIRYAKKNTGPASARIIKVGVSLPLTGPVAEYGEAFKNGITLAQEQSGNTSVQYVFEDDAYDPRQSVASFYKLTSIDKVDVLVSWGGVPSDAIYPLVKGKSLPYIAGSFMARTAETSPYTIRLYDTPDDFANHIWSYLRAHYYKHIAIIKAEALYPNVVLEALMKAKNPDESLTVVENYLSVDEKDFRSSILKIKDVSAKYDAVGVLLFAGQIGQFYKQAGTFGLHTPTFGTDFFESQSDINVAGNSINGAVFPNYSASDKFQSDYKKQFGNTSQISYAGSGYDMANMLATIKSSDKDAILASLESVKNFDGVMGVYNYTETADKTDRYFSSPVHMKMIENGVIKTID